MFGRELSLDPEREPLRFDLGDDGLPMLIEFGQAEIAGDLLPLRQVAGDEAGDRNLGPREAATPPGRAGGRGRS